MIDKLPRHERILTPNGHVEVDIDPGATALDLIEHLIDEADLVRGDIFELFVDERHIPPEASLEALPKGRVILVATGGGV